MKSVKSTTAVIIRHPKERLSKCSLEPLRAENRDGFTFLKASEELRFDATGFLLLAVDAPQIRSADAQLTEEEIAHLKQVHPQLGFASSQLLMRRPLLLLDSTWRLLPQLQACVTGNPVQRSLPTSVTTAYPRISKISADPQGGLASIEALYLALKLLGEDEPSLLDSYHWKNAFLKNLKLAGYACNLRE